MAFKMAPRILEMAATAALLDFTLGGAVTNFQAFSSYLSNSDTTYYCAVNAGQFEVGIGTYNSGVLQRTSVLQSSNSNNKVNFSAAPRVWCAVPVTDQMSYLNAVVRDDGFRIAGSSDSTKRAAFEVDGFTTATTRTFTLPNRNGTLMTGPTTTVDHTLARFDGTSGDVQGSGVVVDDSNNVSVPGTLTVTGAASLNGGGTLGDASGDTVVIKGTTVNAYSSGLLDNSNASAWRTDLGVAIGSDVQAYDADLSALAALNSTGIAVRTASNTWAQRTITGTANEIGVTNGNGVSGNPTLSLPSSLTFTGKTVSGGTFSNITLSGTTTLPGGGAITSGGSLSIGGNGFVLGATTPSGDVIQDISGVSGSISRLRWRVGGVTRWEFSREGNETGSDAGSNFGLSRYSDAGSWLGYQMVFDRATGHVAIGSVTTPAERLHVSGNAYISGVIELGNASDTTLARLSAGDISVEGNRVFRVGGVDVPVADGGTGVSTLTSGNVLVGNGTSAVQTTKAAPSGNFVGTSDTQTLTNKTLTSPTINTAVLGSAVASQAQMEAGSSTTTIVTPGRQHFHPSAAKGWAKFDSTGGNLASYNVTSIVDSGVGDWAVNWNVDFSSNQYCAVVTCEIASYSYLANIQSTLAGTTRVQCWDPGVGRVDASNCFVVAYGDQ